MRSLGAALLIATGSTSSMLAQTTQKPFCSVSAAARAAEKSRPPAAELLGTDNSADLPTEKRKAAIADARAAVKRAEAEAAPKSDQGLLSVFSPSNTAKTSDAKRQNVQIALERQYLVPVLQKYQISCAGLRMLVDNDKPVAEAPSK